MLTIGLVLILVLMEYALRFIFRRNNSVCWRVLILVLMEYALRSEMQAITVFKRAVLILVLMEYALRSKYNPELYAEMLEES